MSIHSKIAISGIIVLFITVYITALSQAGKWLVKGDQEVHADAIVMLTGSFADRILQVVDLYQKNLAKNIIAVEEGIDANKELEARGIHIISTKDQTKNAALALGIPAERLIILPGNARSTQEEAAIIWHYIQDKSEIDTLLLVSSSYHTRRASMIFKNAFKNSQKQVLIYWIPSKYNTFNPERWWKNKEDIQIVLSEYLKLASFLIFERWND